MSLNIWQYAWFIILTLAFMLVMTKCVFPMEEASDRGGNPKVVETWPWE